jgi:hypothetical protein
MTSQEIEQEIQQILATETSAISLSEKIFSQEGLFSKLAHSYEERKALVQSPLYQQAQKRFRELQFGEVDAFRHKVAELRAVGMDKKSVVKIQRTKSA